MRDVLIYSSNFCGFCRRAKALLEQKGVAYREICVDGDPQSRQEMMARSGRHTVPQIWVGETHVGGCDDLFAAEFGGELDVLLQAEASVQ